MNEDNLSYETFNKTLIKVITEKGFNEEIINVIIKLINNYSFHYNEFINSYIEK